MSASVSTVILYSKYTTTTATLPSSDLRGFNNPSFQRKKHRRRYVLRAAAPNTDNKNENAQNDEQSSSSSPVSLSLDDVNPVGLGRRSRQLFDEVWRKFSGLGQISRTIRTDDQDALLVGESGPMCEFAIPGAQNTTVLVVGATSRIGRIVVRKLMLRGYSVKALVRTSDEESVQLLPRSVEIVIGDVGDPTTVKAAVEGSNKIIYCATARSTITADLFRVDHQGVYNLSKAFQVSCACVFFNLSTINISIYAIAVLLMQPTTILYFRITIINWLSCGLVKAAKVSLWWLNSNLNLP
jgi:hypothetical protein